MCPAGREEDAIGKGRRANLRGNLSSRLIPRLVELLRCRVKNELFNDVIETNYNNYECNYAIVV